MMENMMDGCSIGGEMEETKSKKYNFKLGNNFSNFVSDVMEERLNNLDYSEALDFLRTVGLGEKEAIGVLFGDYEVANNEEEIIVCDNYTDRKLDPYKPIEKFINNYIKVYREILEITVNILYYPNHRRKIFINIYDTDDCDIPLVNKYFPFSIDLITNSKGGMDVNSVKFFNTLYTALNNGEFYELLSVLVSSYNRRDLESYAEYYFDARKILDVWNKVSLCMSFIEKYRPNTIETRELQNKISGIKEAFETSYVSILHFREIQ